MQHVATPQELRPGQDPLETSRSRTLEASCETRLEGPKDVQRQSTPAVRHGQLEDTVPWSLHVATRISLDYPIMHFASCAGCVSLKANMRKHKAGGRLPTMPMPYDHMGQKTRGLKVSRVMLQAFEPRWAARTALAPARSWHRDPGVERSFLSSGAKSN